MPLPKRFEKLTPIDYAVLFGGPIAFLLIAWFGLMALAGPPPRPNPFKLLQDGTVTVGMPADKAMEKVGKPTSIQEKEDGSFVLHYLRTSLDGASLSSDEAQIEIGADGRVTGIRFDRSAPPSPGSGKAE
jgi:hypothetical protein